MPEQSECQPDPNASTTVEERRFSAALSDPTIPGFSPRELRVESNLCSTCRRKLCRSETPPRTTQGRGAVE